MALIGRGGKFVSAGGTLISGDPSACTCCGEVCGEALCNDGTTSNIVTVSFTGITEGGFINCVGSNCEDLDRSVSCELYSVSSGGRLYRWSSRGAVDGPITTAKNQPLRCFLERGTPEDFEICGFTGTIYSASASLQWDNRGFNNNPGNIILSTSYAYQTSLVSNFIAAAGFTTSINAADIASYDPDRGRWYIDTEFCDIDAELNYVFGASTNNSLCTGAGATSRFTMT